MKSFNNLSKRNFNILCIFGVVALLIINYTFQITYGMNIIIILVLLFAIVRTDGKVLFKDWSLPVGLMYVYEVSRAYSYQIGSSLGASLTVEPLVTIERQLFFFLEDIPTVVLQDVVDPVLSSPQWFDYVLLMFYGVFFWGWALAGFYLWQYKRKYFKQYVYGLIALSFFSVFIFIIFPTAPPWYASEIGLIPNVDRLLWEFEYFGETTFGSLQQYGRNDFAAVPSLHTAWTFYMALFFAKVFGKKGLVFFIVPLGVAFATWYGAEHYVIDSIIGAVFAGLAFYLETSQRVVRYLKRIYSPPSSIPTLS